MGWMTRMGMTQLQLDPAMVDRLRNGEWTTGLVGVPGEKHCCDEHCVCPDHGTQMWWSAMQDLHACQDPACRYASGLENKPDDRASQRATRRPVSSDMWEWTGAANGCTARHLTTDASLTLFVRPVFERQTQGVELVDQHGTRMAFEVLDPRAL